MNELSKQTLDALQAYRAEPAMGEPDKAQLWARIETSVEAGAPGPQLAAASPRRVDVRRTAVRLVVALAAAAAVLLLVRAVDWRGLANGSQAGAAHDQAVYGERASDSVWSADNASPNGVAKPSDSTVTSPVDHDDGPTQRAAIEQPQEAAASGEPSRSRRPNTPPPARVSSPHRGASDRQRPTDSDAKSSPATTPDDSLHKELRAMGRVRAALAADRPDDALAALAQHAARYPDGQMTQDREALTVQALCAAGRDARAHAAAQAFLLAHPKSPYATQVSAARTRAAEKKCATP